MQVRTLHAGIFFFGAIALSFLVRAFELSTALREHSSLRLGGFRWSMRIGSSIPLFSTRRPVTTAGSGARPLLDLSYCLLIVIAGTG